ncbi:MAG: arsenic resistance N-acetyltransferase ArsN2 [Desulfobacterales bacterium]
MGKLKFSFATPADEIVLKQFLETNNLLNEDIEPADLKHFLMARDGTEVIGLVGLEIKADCALLRSLAVKKDYRNKGLATLLVDKIEEHARTLNINTLYLLTLTAEAFFSQHEFKRTEREMAPRGIQNTAEFKDLCPASAALMVKTIAAGTQGEFLQRKELRGELNDGQNFGEDEKRRVLPGKSPGKKRKII